MNHTPTPVTLRTIIARELTVDLDELTRETDLFRHGGLDSLDTITVVMQVENEYDITIPDDSLERIRTLGQFEDLVERLIEEKARV